jgi:hypothetical protein
MVPPSPPPPSYARTWTTYYGGRKYGDGPWTAYYLWKRRSPDTPVGEGRWAIGSGLRKPQPSGLEWVVPDTSFHCDGDVLYEIDSAWPWTSVRVNVCGRDGACRMRRAPGLQLVTGFGAAPSATSTPPKPASSSSSPTRTLVAVACMAAALVVLGCAYVCVLASRKRTKRVLKGPARVALQNRLLE